MKNLFQNRAVGFWLDLAGTVLTLVGIILYALYAADTGSNNVWVYIGLVAAVAVSKIGAIMRICVVVAISMLALLISSFMRKDKAM